MQLLSPTFSSDSLYLPATPEFSEQLHNRLLSDAADVIGHADSDPGDAPHRHCGPETHRLSTHLSWHACTILRHVASAVSM
jgi:hypothetical protein